MAFPPLEHVREVQWRMNAASVLLLRTLADPENAPPLVIMPGINRILEEAEAWLAGERGDSAAL